MRHAVRSGVRCRRSAIAASIGAAAQPEDGRSPGVLGEKVDQESLRDVYLALRLPVEYDQAPAQLCHRKPEQERWVKRLCPVSEGRAEP